MRAAHALRGYLVDNPRSAGERKRTRRWEWLRETFPDLDRMSVIDLGGTAGSWQRAPVRPAAVHDACNLPDRILSDHYDLVFSNAVLEHVGGHAQRMRFAEAVHKLADRHWVQTPYRYFPIEPHWLFPGFQFLPVNMRVAVARRWPLAYGGASTREDALWATLNVELIGRTEMAYCFPDSAIRVERMLGLVKSLIAVRA
jgi:hypothetical protein